MRFMSARRTPLFWVVSSRSAVGAVDGLVEPSYGLPDPVGVLDQREAHVAFAAGAEAGAGGDGDACLAGQELGERERVELAV